MKLTDLLLNRFLYKDNLQNLETKDSSYNAGNVVEAEVPAIASGGAAQDINTSNVFIDGKQIEPGTIPQTVLDVSNWGWGQTCAFTSTDLNTVTWGAGVFTSAGGEVYNIGTGNTGNMAAKTYIYLDLNVSDIAYQITTTPADAVGIGKVLIAVAQNAAVSATYNLSEATQIVGDNILANTINASKLTVGQLSAISADLGSMTAGTITGALIRTSAGDQRVEMKNDNTLIFYDGGISRTYISNGIITFNRPSGTGCGTIAGWGSNQIGITVGAESFYFDTGAMWTDSSTNLGKTGDRWGNAYFGGTIDAYGDLQVDGIGNIGGELTVTDNVRANSFSIGASAGEDVFSNFLGYDGTTGITLGFDGGLLIYYAEF